MFGNLKTIGCTIGTMVLVGSLTLIVGMILPNRIVIATGAGLLALSGIFFVFAVWRLKRTLTGIASSYDEKIRDFVKEAETGGGVKDADYEVRDSGGGEPPTT